MIGFENGYSMEIQKIKKGFVSLTNPGLSSSPYIYNKLKINLQREKKKLKSESNG